MAETTTYTRDEIRDKLANDVLWVTRDGVRYLITWSESADAIYRWREGSERATQASSLR